MEVHVAVRMFDGVPVVGVTGELDIYTSPKLKTVVDGLLEKAYIHLVVNLLETTYLDSTAMAILSSALKRAREAGGNLALVYNQPLLDKLFSVTGLSEVFPVFRSEEEALSTARTWLTAGRKV